MPKKRRTDLNGLIVVDKPQGPTSMGVVRRVRHAAGNAKTGHAGTLDPLATGVVICCLGKATKAVPQLMDLTKIYETTIDLTAFTTTDDREGDRTEVDIATPPTEQEMRGVLPRFVGAIEQRPPAFSAIHIDGQRAYKLARRGEAVEVPTRTVQVHAIECLGYAFPELSLRITCGKGTYIRSLGRDIGTALGTGGHLASLHRTAVGGYTLEQAVAWERLGQPIEAEHLLPIPDAAPNA